MESDNKHIILGITGTLGAGKGTVVDYLVNNKGFIHFSVRAFLVDELKHRKIPVNRDTMVLLANELRTTNNPAYIIEELYKQAAAADRNCIIESIRTPGEITALRENPGFVLMAVDADPKERYKRIQRRNSETDNISYSTFIDNENREMYSDDPNKQNISACIQLADHIISNDGDINSLHQAIESFIHKYLG
jgi:dephospho-CoA kinase